MVARGFLKRDGCQIHPPSEAFRGSGKGIRALDVEKQLERFGKGCTPRRLLRPATVGDGVKRLRSGEARQFLKIYEESLAETSVCKFIPASGVASRMFGQLDALRVAFSAGKPASAARAGEALEKFVLNLKRFPFAGQLERSLGRDIDEVVSSGDFGPLLNALLGDEGLGYGNIPKGLVPFHDYEEGPRTAFCEHFAEAAGYANSHGAVSMHFTIPPAFADEFALEEKKAKVLFSSNEVSFDVSYSAQNPETDTVVVGADGEPVRDAFGSLVRRPAGHGALLGNLNALSSDLVFIKNIDNVVKEELLPDTIRWKKILGGMLLFLRRRVFHFLDSLRSSGFSEPLAKDAVSFCARELFLDLSAVLDEPAPEKKKEALLRALDRPIRVCGAVKNEGEPGGGPFWTETENGESLQIVESAEVDRNSPSQMSVWQSSTHFNPVDIVCGTTNSVGKKFNLFDFVDHEAGIITEKILEGEKIKALELPGLWNGSMAGWITVFVEVPSSTFNPVKTVLDLLKEPHQAA